MSNFIQDFYYGRFEPWVHRIRPGSEAQRISETLSQNEEALINRLTGDELKLFQAYMKVWGEVLASNCLDNFICGFRLGAGFTYDTFIRDDCSYNQPRKGGAGCCSE